MLARALGTTRKFWLDLQQPADIEMAKANKHATVKADRIFDGSGIEKAFNMTVAYIETPFGKLDEKVLREMFGGITQIRRGTVNLKPNLEPCDLLDDQA